MARQRLRFLHKHGLGVHRLEVGDGTAPVAPPLWIQPSSAPSGTAQAGDVYFDSTTNDLLTHNGTAFRNAAAGLLVPKTAAATLTAADNGKTCFFNSAAGDIYTLPVPVAGMRFRFVVLVTITSNAAKVITDSGSTFLLGTFVQSTDGTYTVALRAADGTTIRAWSGNGSTTGGIKGDWFEVVALSTTQWAIWGMGSATGTEATPFATS